ncbi:glycoside hydrolase family 130 protein [Vallitalea pronyensis]|uniref:Glycoside hydrolase family 130 protein n=2 Tax=Vallitalea pronyensis TaxID=1348613 RepID=A0A8J8MQU3_9FIRM|nr:glycoside hydrolase family 130 protein [Vallitalea pronyensis]
MQILTKYEKNPIIQPKDMPFSCETVYNAGAAKMDEQYVLLLRCGRSDGRSVWGLALSDNGFDFEIHPEPVFSRATEGIFKEAENKGVEDPRVTKIDDTYYIFYSCYSTRGFQIGLAKTKDFLDIQRVALTTAVDYRNCVLFPEKINDMYVRFERPNLTYLGRPGIFISYSPDLIHWGNQQLIMTADSCDIWQDYKIGPGAPPIKTPRGWLNIYHATTATMSGQIYRLGVAVHDLEDPRKVIGRSRRFILAPEAIHERVGYVSNVVFTCGAIPEPDGTIKIYYGGADTVMCVATGEINALIDLAMEDGPDKTVR